MFALNVLGLGVGIATCIMIMLYVGDELSYDRFHEKADQIARVVFKAKVSGEDIREAVVMAPVAETLGRELPEVLLGTRMKNMGRPKIKSQSVIFRNSRFAYVDPNFLKVFTFPVVEGDKISPLDEPNSIVLTRDEAQKYFGAENPIGKILEFEDQGKEYVVTALIENMPNNSHFHFDILGSLVGYPEAKNPSWMESGFFTYLLVRENADLEKLESKLPSIVEKYMGPQIKDAMGVGFTEFTKENQLGLSLQPLTDIHLKSNFSDSTTLEQGGDIRSVQIFGVIAFFMLLIACINFINLSTASATQRMKEVGIRKVLGSDRKQLVLQFLTESFITSMVAVILGFLLVLLLLPSFNQISGKELQAGSLYSFNVILALGLLVLFVDIIAGAYPAFYLSSFRPIRILKSRFSGTKSNKNVRSTLVVFQFMVSACLIMATMVVTKQMQYTNNKDLGYDKDQLLVLRDAYLLEDNQDNFKSQILNDPMVAHVTQSGYVPAGNTNYSMTGMETVDKEFRRMLVYNIDHEYIPTLGMQLLEGRNFAKEYGADSLNIIINETAAKILGFSEDPVGQTITRAIDNQGGRENLHIIGVVKDFHLRSFHQTIDPLIMFHHPNGGFIVRAKSRDMSSLIHNLESIWNSFGMDEPFTYSVLDDSYKQSYVIERKMEKVLRIFTLLTIFVACLGLFGLVTFSIEQRLKEISIRKVLGSSMSAIVAVLTRDLLRLVLISLLLAFPVSYYFMDHWLSGFAYRIQIQWWLFALTGIVTILIAFGTIGIKSAKAALANPIHSLRSE